MRCIVSCLSILLVSACSWSPTRTADGTPTANELTLDQSFEGWECYLADSDPADVRIGDVWSLEDGVLLCAGTPLGYLYTEAEYTDFVLKLRWRWPPGEEPGRGGVLLRMTGSHKIWPRSLEAQINAGDAGDFWGLDGYRLRGPDERMASVDHETFGELTHLRKDRVIEKPAGQWNDYEIIVQGETVTLKINGQVINEAVGCDVVAGRICLTSEGNEIQFRDVRLTALEAGLREEKVP